MGDSVSELSDATLMQRVLAGEPRWFDVLIERYRRALLRVAASRLGRTDWAEDVVQETLLSAFRWRASYDPERNFRTWLWTILLNQCRASYRRRLRDPMIRQFSDARPPSGSLPGCLPAEAPSNSEPDCLPAEAPSNSEPGCLPAEATSNSAPGCLPAEATSNSEPGCLPAETTSNSEPGCLPAETTSNSAPSPILQHPDGQPAPPAVLLARERAELLDTLLARLPTVQADAIRLRFFGSLKYDEIAQTMQCSISGAKNRVRTGLLKLSEMMDESGEWSDEKGMNRRRVRAAHDSLAKADDA